MSSPQIDYDPKAEAPSIDMREDTTTMFSTMSILTEGNIPPSMKKRAHMGEYRDALLSSIVTNMSDLGMERIVETLASKVRTMADKTSDEIRIYCELIAALAYVTNNQDLAKKAILRVDPSQGSGVLKTIYQAMVEHQIDAQQFKRMLESNAPTALRQWEAINPVV